MTDWTVTGPAISVKLVGSHFWKERTESFIMVMAIAITTGRCIVWIRTASSSSVTDSLLRICTSSANTDYNCPSMYRELGIPNCRRFHLERPLGGDGSLFIDGLAHLNFANDDLGHRSFVNHLSAVQLDLTWRRSNR